MGIIEQIIIAVVIASLVGLLLVKLVGPLLKILPGPLGAIAGDFFVEWGWLLGALVGLLAFVQGWSFFGFGGHK